MDKESRAVATRVSLENISRRHEIVAQHGSRERFEVLDEDVGFRKLALSGDGNRLAAAGQNVVCVWNTRSQERSHRFVFECDIAAIAISDDGDFILVADTVNDVHVVDTVFSCVARITRHDAAILSLDMDASGACAAFGDDNGLVTVFDPANFASAYCIDCKEPVGIVRLYAEQDLILVDIWRSVLAYRMSDRRLIARYGEEASAPSPGDAPAVPVLGSAITQLKKYDALDGRVLFDVTALTCTFDYTADGSTIVCGNHGTASVHDGIRGGEIGRVKTYIRSVGDIKIDRSGSTFYICGDDSSVDVFSSAGARLGSYVDLCSPIMAAATTADYRQLVVSDQRGVVAVYDLVSGIAQRYIQHACCISKQAISGSWVATGAHDCFARVLDLQTGETIFSANCNGKPVQGIALDPDGFVITGNMIGMIQKHDIESGEVVAEFHGNNSAIRSLEISRCKNYLMSTSDNGAVLVFDYRTGKLVNRLLDRAIVYSGAFDPSGEFVYFGNDDGQIVKMRSLSAEVVNRWRVHRTSVRSVSIARGKLTSIGICDDAHILDLHSGESLLDCPVATRPFRRVAFLNHDGTRLVTGGQDGRLMIRDAEDGSILVEMHNLGDGHLWATRAQLPQGTDSNWFHTNREDLIQVYGQSAGIETLLAPGDPRREAFVVTHNDQAATMAMARLCPLVRNEDLERELRATPASHDQPGVALLDHRADNS